MSKPKWMRLLIAHKWGSPSLCYNHQHPPEKRAATVVIHENIGPVDLRPFYQQYGEAEFPKVEQRVLRKTHPKQADEKYLCRSCYQGLYLSNPGMYDEDGASLFTSIELDKWKNRNYKTVEDVVLEHLVVNKK